MSVSCHHQRTFGGLTDSAAELLTTRFSWQPVGMPDAFTMNIPEFFDDALG